MSFDFGSFILGWIGGVFCFVIIYFFVDISPKERPDKHHRKPR